MLNACVVLWCLFGLLVGSTRLAGKGRGLRDGWDDDTSWYLYVRAPFERSVAPLAVLKNYTRGNVSNPNGLIDQQESVYMARSTDGGEVPSIVLDFGQVVAGQLTIDFAGAWNYSDGYPGLKLVFSETLQYLVDRSDYGRSHWGGSLAITNETDQISVKSDAYTWIDQYGCEFGNQVCSDGLHGFRYVKIELDALEEDSPYTTSFGSIAISSIRLQYSGYFGSVDSFTGWFDCSNENFSQWWYDGAYTAELGTDVFRANDTEPRDAASPSLLGKMVIHDGAKRDRDPYIGDLAVSALTSYLTHDIPEAARNVMEDLIQHQRDDGWIPPASINGYTLTLFDYPLWWVSCSWEHVMYTGNLSYIEAYYSNLQLVLNSYYPQNTDSSTSLLLRPDGYGDYAFLDRPGSAAYYSALYVLALNRAAQLAGFLSKDSDAEHWRARADTVSDSFVEILWDPAVGAFFDRNCTGTGCTAHAQDGNSLAILSGITPGNSSEAKSALSYLDDSTRHKYGNAFYDAAGDAVIDGASTRVYPFLSYFEIAARFEVGQVSSAFDQINRMYGWMAAHEPGVTFWEGIGADGEPYEAGFTSMAHGWSTGIVPLMTNYVLGVKPVKPGFEEWAVKPLVGDLSWAKGEVPTPRGALKVRWAIDQDDGSYQIWVDAPSGTSGTVSVPYDGEEDDEDKEISVDGEVVWSGKGEAEVGTSLQNGFVEVRVSGGVEHVVAFNRTVG